MSSANRLRRANVPDFFTSSRISTGAAIEVRYGRSGVLWMAAGPGRVERGDVVAVLMNDYDDLAAG